MDPALCFDSLNPLLELPDKSVLSVIGAGGKTTSILYLAEQARRRGKRVLIATTTHMHDRADRLEKEEEIRAALRNDGFAYAGNLENKNGKIRMTALPDEVLSGLIPEADLTLIEADGSRRLPFKVPKSTEPVVFPESTAVLLIAGMRAAGRPVCDVCYNFEALCRLLSISPEDILSPARMAEAYQKTYLTELRAEGFAPVILTVDGSMERTAGKDKRSLYLMAGQLSDAVRRADGREFLSFFTNE